MADIDGNSNVDKMMEFHKTVETRWIKGSRVITNMETGNLEIENVIQQKWVNELGEEEWRDIPLVISE